MLRNGPDGRPSLCSKTSSAGKVGNVAQNPGRLDVLGFAVKDGLAAKSHDEQSGGTVKSSKNAHCLAPGEFL